MIRKSESGFSIIEMMVVAGALAILAAIAIPQIQQSLDAYRLSASARIVASELSRGRMLAMSRNWTYGADMNNAPPSIQIIDPADTDNSPSPIQYLESGVVFSATDPIIFRSRGNSNGGTITLTNTHSASITITVNAAGRIAVGDFTP